MLNMDLLGSEKTKTLSVDSKTVDAVSQHDQISKAMEGHILPQSSGHKHSHTDGHIAKRSVYRKILAVILTIFAVCGEKIVNFYYLSKSKCHITWYWTESCVVTLAAGVFLCRANKLRLGSVSLWSLLSLGGFYTLCTAVDGSALNVFHNSSGGSEIHQIGLAVSPVAAMVGMWCISQKDFREKLFLSMVGCCVLLLILFSSERDGYIHYYFSMKTTSLGIIYGCTLGFSSVTLGQHINHAATSFTEVLFYLSGTCVAILPIAFLLAGELKYISDDGMLTKGPIAFVASVFPLAFFRSLHLAAFLDLIAATSPLVYIATANASWIVSTAVLTFWFKLQILVSTFEAFFLVGLSFVIVLFYDLTQKASESAASGLILDQSQYF